MAKEKITFGEIKKFIDMAPGNYIVFYIDGNRLKALHYSDSVPEAFGMSRNNFELAISDDLLRVIQPTDRDYVYASIFDMPVGSDDIECQFRVNLKSKILWVHTITKVIGTYRDYPLVLSCCINSSTESGFANEIINKSDSRIYVVDSSTFEMLFVSDKAKEYLESKNSYKILPKCYKLFHGLDEPCPDCFILNPGIEPPYGVETYHEDRDQWSRLRCVRLPWYGHDANVVFVDDITLSKKRELAILENQQALASLVKSTPGGIFSYSADDNEEFSFVSDNMLSMLGYTYEEFSTKFNNKFSHMVYADDRERVLREIKEQISVGTHDVCDYRIEKSDGSLMWVHDEGHLVTDTMGNRKFIVVIVDITTTINYSTEMSLHSAELEQIIQNIPAGILVYSKHGNKISIETSNNYLAKLARTTVTTIKTTPYETLMNKVHPEDQQNAKDSMEELFSDKHSTNYTYRSLDAATGEYIWLNCSAYSVDQPDGSQLAYALFTDATEQKEREFRYQNAISEYLTANPNALATIRLNLTADKFVSGQSYAIYDGLLVDCKTASDFLHRLLRDICRNNTGDNFKNDLSRDSLLQRYREGTSELEFEFKYRFKSTTRWASCFINMIQNPTTHDVEAILYTMDVEESVKNREIIQHISGSDCDFVALINVTDRTRVFYSIKGMAADIFPTEAEDYYTSVDKFHLDGGYEDPDEDINNKVKLESIIDALEKDDEYTFTFPRYKADGEERIELLQFSYLDESRTEVVENATDITASFKQQQAHVNELNAALTEARNANAAKSDFLSRVSHDIRTPMNVIHGMTEFALADIGNEEKLREDLRKIQIANTFLLSLINDILDLSRIESGRIKLQLEPYKYSDFIANITGMFKPLCDEKGLTFTVHSQGDPDDIIVVDKVRLNQTVLNLLSNSVKYTPAGGNIDFFAGKENTRGNMTDVYFIVKDNGIGMSPDFQEHMFEAFTQDPRVARASTSDQGTGLGLSIVEKLVNLMGGTISVESKLDEGTTFSVRYHVPFTRKSVPAAEDDVKTSYAPAYQGNGKRILIAEDNALNAEITKRILEQAGYQVDMAENGEAAVNCFENSAIDCYSAILMDIQMPVMNGMEATRAIRNMNRPDAGTIPIIAATANAYSEDVEKCIKAGMNDHVAKPIDSQALYKKLYDIITKNEPQL